MVCGHVPDGVAFWVGPLQAPSQGPGPRPRMALPPSWSTEAGCSPYLFIQQVGKARAGGWCGKRLKHEVITLARCPFLIGQNGVTWPT